MILFVGCRDGGLDDERWIGQMLNRIENSSSQVEIRVIADLIWEPRYVRRDGGCDTEVHRVGGGG